MVDRPLSGRPVADHSSASSVFVFTQNYNTAKIAKILKTITNLLPAGWRSGKTHPRRRRSGVRFPARSNQIQCRRRLVTAATFFRSCAAQALSHGDEPRHSLQASV